MDIKIRGLGGPKAETKAQAPQVSHQPQKSFIGKKDGFKPKPENNFAQFLGSPSPHDWVLNISSTNDPHDAAWWSSELALSLPPLPNEIAPGSDGVAKKDIFDILKSLGSSKDFLVINLHDDFDE